MRMEKATSGAQAGLTTAIVSELGDTHEHPRRDGADRICQAADDRHRKDDADPRLDLRGRQRRDQRDEDARDARRRGAQAREHIGHPGGVHAECRGDLPILGGGAQGLAEHGPVQSDPRADRQDHRAAEREQFEHGNEDRADVQRACA